MEITYKGQGMAGAGQVASQLIKDGGNTLSQINYSYNALGLLTGESGSGTYAKSYGYDPIYGDRTSLTAGGHITTWTYQTTTGLLTRKEYSDGKGINYTYGESGLLHTRTWERGVVTTYSYDGAGNLNGISYSDSTPAVGYTVSRAGRKTSISDAGGTHALTYEADGQLDSDTITGSGILSGYTVDNTQGSHGNRSTFTATGPNGNLTTQGYTFSNGRMATVAAHGQTMTYGYKSNTDLVETTAFNNGTSDVFTRTATYDANSRIANVSGATPLGAIAKHRYSYDSRSRRTGVLRENSDTWAYSYNDKNELETGVKKFSDSTNIPGHNFGYAFDSIGNRESVSLEGVTYTYGTANNVNQLTTRVVPSYYTVEGTANVDAKVMVNNSLAARKGDFWSKVLSVDNDSTVGYLPVTIKGKLMGAGGSGEDLVAQQAGNLLIPKTPESFTYDDDGNLTVDGLWNYTWDGENRLIQMESISGVPAAAKKKLAFDYDGQSRRIQKKVYTWNGGTSVYDLQSTTKFVYDGWNLVAETEGADVLKRTFVWGLDLSGSLQGAGGVGGLLLVRDVSASKNYYAYSDGNGNISKLIDSTAGAIAAEYEYSPFGETLVQSGEAAKVNPIQWSSKYSDSETKLVYYGFRFYNPTTGRWVNRDPLGERGGINVYGFVKNRPTNSHDKLGLYTIDAQSETLIGKLYRRMQPKAREHLQRLGTELEAQNKIPYINQTLRTTEQQQEIVAKGAGTTRASGLKSYHIWGLAYDIEIRCGGKDVEAAGTKGKDPAYDLSGRIGKSLNLEWGGDWKDPEDRPHFQWPLGSYRLSRANKYDLEYYWRRFGDGRTPPQFANDFLEMSDPDPDFNLNQPPPEEPNGLGPLIPDPGFGNLSE